MSQQASFIRLNHHLPEMPSTQEVESQGGFDLAFMSTALLKRSEENTLYILQLEEKARSTAKDLEEQKALTQSAQASSEALELKLALWKPNLKRFCKLLLQRKTKRNFVDLCCSAFN